MFSLNKLVRINYHKQQHQDSPTTCMNKVSTSLILYDEKNINEQIKNC